MAISIHNYTILDHLADYLLRIREAVQGDGSYQYVCVMERRCFNLIARFSPELLDRVVTSNGLLCMGKEIARYYEENYDFPRMLVCDDIVIHGRNLARFFYGLEEEIVGILEAKGYEFAFEQRRALHRRLMDAVDICAYVRSKHPLLLEYGYIQKIEYDHACSDMEIHDISLQITDFLNRSGATSTSFVISFPKTVLTRQVETDVGDWKRGERNLYGCVNENESAPNRRMISYIRTVCEGRPQSWISTVRYYPGEEKNQWITSAPIFEDCSLKKLQNICQQIVLCLEKEQARGKQYQKLRSILREEKTPQLQEVRWQLVSFFASVADFFDFYEAYEGQLVQDEAAQKELVDGSNWRKISANFRGIEEWGRNDQRTDEELYRFCCDRVLQRAVQGILNVEMKPFVLQPVGHILDGSKHIVDAAASQVASEEGMRQEADAYALEERPYSFQPERHNGGIISFSSFFKKMSELVEASISVVEGTTTILKLMDDGVVGLRLQQDSETKELQTVLKVGELATFYWPMQLSVYVPALALVERSCWRQNMEQKEAVLRFLKEQAFEPGDKLPKHLEEKKFEVADVQRCLLAWTEKLYHAGQSYRGWDFDNLEQRREQEVQEEGIRATMLNRAKEFLYLQ